MVKKLTQSDLPNFCYLHKINNNTFYLIVINFIICRLKYAEILYFSRKLCELKKKL